MVNLDETALTQKLDLSLGWFAVSKIYRFAIGTDWALLVHESVRKCGEVMGGFRIEGEEMPDLPVVGPGDFRIFDEVAVDAGLGLSSTRRRNLGACSVFNVFMRFPCVDQVGTEIEEVLGWQSEGVGDAVEASK